MELIIGCVKVLVGTFVLFTLSRVTYEPLVKKSGWAWIAFVAGLSILNMLVHRGLNSTITPPVFTAFWFGVTLAGLSPKEAPKVALWHRRAIYGVLVGTLIGWVSYIEVASAIGRSTTATR